MNLKKMEDLCALAGNEASPQPNVGDDVMAWVQAEAVMTCQWVQRPMRWCAGAAATAAMVALTCALWQAHRGADPLWEVTECIVWVLP